MILTALNNYYDRLSRQGVEGLPPYGFSQEKISYALVIGLDGDLIDVISLLNTSGKKARPSLKLVPQPPKRAVNIAPCFLWDKSGYVLGLTASNSEKDLNRVKLTHDAFIEYHRKWLADSSDKGMQAVLKFLDRWNPEDVELRSKIPDEVLDSNLVFRLDGEMSLLHETEEASRIRSRQLLSDGKSDVTCLISGAPASAVLLHPSIKGVNGAQSSGASLVSFNLDAFTSYGKEQGGNAPVSDRAAFAYGTALNYLLRRDEHNHQRLQIGDTTTVFWSEANTPEEADQAEALFGFCLSPPSEEQLDAEQGQLLHSALVKVAKGRPLREIGQELDPSTKIFVLGLAPNAARLSVRFWLTDTLGAFTRKLGQHYLDLYLDPCPWKSEPAVWRLLSETVAHRPGSKPKLDDVPPQLAGELTRAILTGGRYPRSLLTNLIMRMRADGDVTPLRVALCKAVLAREARIGSYQDKEIPVSLDTSNDDSGYLLGRLFATLESIQKSALGKDVNATIKDRFYGAASATPASVYPLLIRNSQNHLSKVRKNKPGLAVVFEKRLDEMVDKLSTTFPKTLGLEAQGRFAIGYYHQRSEIFKKHEKEIQDGAEQ